MATTTRRTFLAGSALAGGTAAATGLGAGSAAALGRVPVRRSRRRVVIVGSGFGGAVTALRLTRAGVKVTLLEQGRR